MLRNMRCDIRGYDKRTVENILWKAMLYSELMRTRIEHYDRQ